MNFNIISSVQHMASIKIALSLYYGNIGEILDLERDLPTTAHNFDPESHKIWIEIETKAAYKLTSLPNLLKARVPKFIRPIHLETEKWVIDHQGIGYSFIRFSYRTLKRILCWKADGTIDRAQTATKFVRNQNFNIETRFSMACIYFLENEVLALWHGNEPLGFRDVSEIGTNAAVRFWVSCLKKGSSISKPWEERIGGYFNRPRDYLSDGPIRISCLFPYLSWESKQNYLSRIRLGTAHSDDFHLCLKSLDERKRVEVFYKYPERCLSCCLELPFQPLFIDMANQLWNHMNAGDFYTLLDRIIRFYILRGLGDFDYLRLFKEFWHQSPDAFKKEINNRKHCFKVIEVILNHDEGKSSLSLPKTLGEFIPKYWN